MTLKMDYTLLKADAPDLSALLDVGGRLTNLGVWVYIHIPKSKVYHSESQ